jgi:hypothetical protein
MAQALSLEFRTVPTITDIRFLEVISSKLVYGALRLLRAISSLKVETERLFH